MTPEECARKKIDTLLELAGWRVQDLKDYDPTQSLGVAVREFPLSAGEADYALFIDRKCVGVCESVKIESKPLERKRGISFEKLVQSIAFGVRDADTLISLAGRLSRLDRELVETDRKTIQSAADGKSLRRMINDLFDAVDPDRQADKAKELFETDTPTAEQVKKAGEDLAKEACAPFEVPQIRNTIVAIHKKNEQVIDTVSSDSVLEAGWDAQAALKSRTVVDTFQKFIEENKNELDALQIIYSRPYGHRHFTYEQIRQLADAIHKPPYNLSTEQVWHAYEQLEMIRDHIAGSAAIDVEDFDAIPINQWGGRIKAYNLFGNDLPIILNELNEALT
jgi:type I restriction enzyme R subunit